MTLIERDTRLCDIILADPSVVTVLERFGITMGVGDNTVAQACDKQGVDSEFVCTILNTYANPDFFPDIAIDHRHASAVVAYLRQTNAHYAHFLLPNIERHFRLLLTHSEPGNTSLPLLMQFFGEVKEELTNRISDDETRWFPSIEKLVAKPSPTRESVEIAEEDTIETKLGDLVNMIVMHLSGSYDHNLALAVLTACMSLKKDIVQNNRIRYRLLHPISEALAANK